MPRFRHRSARVPARRPPRARLAGLVGVALAASPLAVATGTGDAATPGATDSAVEPVGEWVRIVDVRWREERVGVHLRTGYARPLILPEPVRAAEPATLPGADVRIDAELVVFEPSAHFPAHPIDFVGLESGRVYRFRVRSSTTGKRVPLRVVLP